MLQYHSVKPDTLDLLKKLMSSGFLEDFILVGGTALALQIGHRKSYDLDFFTHRNFKPKILAAEIGKITDVQIIGEADNTLNALIDGIPVDFIRYDYPYIDEIINLDNIRLASKKDIACMKLSAIASRGSKKDFFDIYYLLNEYSLDEMLGFYERKYQSSERFHLIKSLIYFDDAENEPDPITIIPIEWKVVKNSLQNIVRLLLK
jgi:predicted nucleotidyltransferase component of viral defense system